jgi:hypothetical protein
MEFEVIPNLLLMAGALACAFWVCLPDALFLLGLTHVRSGVLGGPEDVRCDTSNPLTEEIAQQLDALGFVPAGLYWERLPMHKTFRGVVFVSRASDCFATVTRLWNNDTPRVSFKTAFRGIAVVFTKNYVGGMEANEETLWVGGLPPQATVQANTDPAPERIWHRALLEEVLEEHRRRVSRFVLAGHIPKPATTVDDYVESVPTYSDHPTVRHQFRNNVAWLFCLKLAFLVSGPGLFTLMGASHDVILSLLLAESVGVLLFRYFGYPLLVAVAALHMILPVKTPHRI